MLKGSKFAVVKSELWNIKIKCGSIEVRILRSPPPSQKSRDKVLFTHQLADLSLQWSL